MGRKGGGFEREFCKALGRWWSAGVRDDLFWRTGGSGGRATARHKRGRSTVGGEGDVMACDPSGFPLLQAITFELKRGYSTLSVQDLVDKPGRSRIAEWLVKLRETSRRSGTPYWILVWRRDQRNTLFLFPAILEQRLLNTGAFADGVLPRMEITAQIGQEVEQLVAMKSSQFFAEVTPAQAGMLAHDRET